MKEKEISLCGHKFRVQFHICHTYVEMWTVGKWNAHFQCEMYPHWSPFLYLPGKDGRGMGRVKSAIKRELQQAGR